MQHPGNEDLGNVLWLGGSACAGKTAVGRLLAERHGLTLYSCDDRFDEHRRRASPERHPRFHRLMDVPVEELWLRPAAEQAADLLGFYENEFGMVLEDLTALSGPVLAEGVGLLPDLLSQAAVDPRRAIWLVSDEAFRLRAYPQRGPWVDEMLAATGDPERAFSEWMRRDSLIADAITEGARRIGGRLIRVDGGKTIEETATATADRLGLFKES